MDTGVIIKNQEADYIAGTISYEEVCNDWTPFLPKGEKQHGLYFDTMACVTFSALNIVEIQLNQLLFESKISEEAVKFFSDEGYLLNGQFNFSDRFTAKMSGTTERGNYLQAVWDSIRNHGLLPEKDWNYPREQRTPVFDRLDYYKEIPQELKDKALRVLDYIEVEYEWIIKNNLDKYTDNELEMLKRELKQAPLHLAAPTCNWNGPQPIEPCGKTSASHATVIYKVDDFIYDYDSYDDFTKKLSLKYIMPWIMKGIVTLKTKPKKMFKLIKEKERPETYAVINGKNYYIRNVQTFEDFIAAGYMNWDKVKEVDYPITVDGIIAG